MNRTSEAQGTGEADGPRLEDVLHLLWERQDRLEEHHLRARNAMALFALASVGTAAWWSTWSAPDAPQVARAPFVIEDASGQPRAKIDVDERTGLASFSLLARNGRPQANLLAGESGPEFAFYDADGKQKLKLGPTEGAPIVEASDVAPAIEGAPILPAAVAGSAKIRTRPSGSRNTAPAAEFVRTASPRRKGSANCVPGRPGCPQIAAGESDQPQGWFRRTLRSLGLGFGESSRERAAEVSTKRNSSGERVFD